MEEAKKTCCGREGSRQSAPLADSGAPVSPSSPNSPNSTAACLSPGAAAASPEGRDIPEPVNLEEVRVAIDGIDDQLLDLLSRRAAMSQAVGRIKSRQRGEGHKGHIFHPERERAVLERLSAHNAGPLPNSHVHAIWREIFSSSRSLQAPQIVACLGPEGTFSHAAVLSCFGQSVQVALKGDFDSVFRAVNDGAASFGMVPLENSLHGSVGQNFDLFLRYPLRIVAEQYSRIHLCLLSAENSHNTVRVVHSHPQPLAQSDNWLNQHLPGVQRIPEESTAAAARLVVNKPGAAAIGHRCLADMLGLNILDEGIEDLPDNWTRFVVISRDSEEARAAQAPSSDLFAENEPHDMKTSLLFTTKHRPGALVAVLRCFSDAGFNLMKLESRPARGQQWQYVFFADLGADLENPKHAAVLAMLDKICSTWRILGVYPAAQVRELLI